jgi:hypothetical protein
MTGKSGVKLKNICYCRILKIENSVESIVRNLDVMDRLSFKEKKFAANLISLNSAHFEGNIM